VCEWSVKVHAIYKLDIAKGWVRAPGVRVGALHFSTESDHKKGVLIQQCCVLYCELLVGGGRGRAEGEPCGDDPLIVVFYSK
jgi:hypothetical protein